ncbi:Nudix hydrolase 6-like [Parasponia andersonii]|uniref:Nudix hydrolase 6-like n=1 Tax=Parasponia andersonii TaxID=3476 RepID=A0A2P5CN55_PARAD|nr:Nudix hydrolase 6-like [Parasponia andersonii]
MATAIGVSKWPLIGSVSRKKYDSANNYFSKGFSQSKIFLRKPSMNSSPLIFHEVGAGHTHMLKKTAINVLTPNRSSPTTTTEFLDAWNDDYNGVVIDPDSLPISANAFANALRASLANWKLKGKKGIWLKLLLEKAELVPIAIQEGFKYHHAESGYVMLAYWIPDELCLLPSGPSHQIGVGGFVINDKREVLVVKENCPYSCSGVWKLPTGYINKSEDIFSGAIREVKEETGIDTVFLEIVAFRHAHLMAFENSDLLFICMLKPLSFDITIDEKEIQAAKWMPLNEFMGQPFHLEDPMSKKVIDICIAAHEHRYSGGYIGQQLPSKLDRKLSHLYYAQSK